MPSVYMIDPKNAPALPASFMSLVFWPNFKFEIPEKRLFLKDIMEQYQKPFFDVAGDVQSADFVAVPFEYFFVKKYAPEYLERSYKIAEDAGKKVLLFDYTDYADITPKLPPHAVIFRVSLYRHHRQKNEIVMPYFVEDFGTKYGIKPKAKSEKLTVGYCGQAQFGNTVKKIKAVIKRIAKSSALYLMGDSNVSVHARGIFWRQRAIRALKKGGIPAKIIERPFYSLHSKGVTEDPVKIRQEYAKNLEECDLALCVRGDANASQRFYESLSAYRVPLFVDTDCALPLEELIHYDDLMARVSWENIDTIDKYVASFKNIPAQIFRQKEELAKKTYDDYLRLDKFFSIVFDREKSPYKDILF